MPSRTKSAKPPAVKIPGRTHPYTGARMSTTSFDADRQSMDQATLEESQRISKEIDERLSEAKKAFEKKKKAVQILLLGMRYVILLMFAASTTYDAPQDSQSREKSVILSVNTIINYC
jgi:hypothetical protein